MALLLLVGTQYVRRRNQKVPPAVVTWSDHDMRTFLEETSGLIPPEVALPVYTAESGLLPKASSGKAWGIAQMIPQTLKAIGWTKSPKEFGQLSVAQQAPWIARLQAMQIREAGRPQTALDYYVLNFCPRAFVAKDDVLYRAPSAAYNENRNLDRGAKGYISRDDLRVPLERAQSTQTLRLALEQARRLQPTTARLLP